MLTRRSFLALLAGLPLAGLASTGWTLSAKSESGFGIPITMFHKVDNTPRHPEDLSPQQLRAVFDAAWDQGFYPVNVSDILAGRVDSLVPKGGKPMGVTIDDAHQSTVFAGNTVEGRPNSRSFVDVFEESCAASGRVPRATFFLAEDSDDRVPGLEGYFGDNSRILEALERITSHPGLEAAFHTRRHKLVKNLGYEAMHALMEEQIHQLDKLGALPMMTRIFSYPYGIPCAATGIQALRDLGFAGAVIARPGLGEGYKGDDPLCLYDAELRDDPFLLPRMNIGAGRIRPGFL